MMRYNSICDIIGPIMVGPSSSHTAGAVRIGQLARSIYGGRAEKAEIYFYGSFAHTYRGHGTDVAIVAGLLGLSTFDNQIPQAMQLAEKVGMEVKISARHETPPHPNTARISLHGALGTLDIVGISIGGGIVNIIEINGFRVQLQGDSPALLVMHKDKAGVIAAVTSFFTEYHINISHMEVSRQSRGKSALMVIETDEALPNRMKMDIRALPAAERVIEVRI